MLTLHLTAIILTLLSVSNIKIEQIANFLPLFDVMIIYYFSVYKEEVFSIWFLFILGIISDSITGLPLGVTSLGYITIVKLFNIVNQKIVLKETFLQIFQQFIVFAFAILFFKFALLSLYHLQIHNAINPLIQLIISAVTYIFMHKFFDFLNKKLLGEDISA